MRRTKRLCDHLRGQGFFGPNPGLASHPGLTSVTSSRSGTSLGGRGKGRYFQSSHRAWRVSSATKPLLHISRMASNNATERLHMDTDSIQKITILRAPRSRVWRAISDSAEFGSWFGMRIDGPFAPGTVMKCAITPTTADAEIAAAQKPYEGTAFEIVIDRIEPERHFSFRWHPYAVEKGIDYSVEPSTLVVFELEDAPEGTRLTLTESGFDQIPLERRAKAFEMNDGGWTAQMMLIEKYLANAP
jgi:uncharacterized protein YndB with AHSA1/START domain